MEVARELSKRDEFNVHLSISRNCDLYAELKALNLPGLDIDTYRDVGSAVMAIPRIRRVRRAFENYLAEHDIDLAALHALPEAQREALVLQHWHGWTLNRIAKHLNRTPAAVAGLLHRGLRQLRADLAGRDGL